MITNAQFNAACEQLKAVNDEHGLLQATVYVDKLGSTHGYDGPLYSFLLDRLEDMGRILSETRIKILTPSHN